MFFIVWLIPCAVAKNISTELVARFIDGMAGSAFLSVAGGTVGDLFVGYQVLALISMLTKMFQNRDELQAPMMIFTASRKSL